MRKRDLKALSIDEFINVLNCIHQRISHSTPLSSYFYYKMWYEFIQSGIILTSRCSPAFEKWFTSGLSISKECRIKISFNIDAAISLVINALEQSNEFPFWDITVHDILEIQEQLDYRDCGDVVLDDNALSTPVIAVIMMTDGVRKFTVIDGNHRTTAVIKQRIPNFPIYIINNDFIPTHFFVFICDWALFHLFTGANILINSSIAEQIRYLRRLRFFLRSASELFSSAE